MVTVSGPRGKLAMGFSGRVKISGRAASMNGSAKNAPRDSRNGPSPAVAESMTRAAQAIARATKDPVGSRLTATMKAMVSRNFSRASAAWSGLCRAM